MYLHCTNSGFSVITPAERVVSKAEPGKKDKMTEAFRRSEVSRSRSDSVCVKLLNKGPCNYEE